MRERIEHSWNNWMQVASHTLHIVYPGRHPEGRDREAYLFHMVKGAMPIEHRQDRYDRSQFTAEELADLDVLRELINRANSLLQQIKEVAAEYEVVGEEEHLGRKRGYILIPEGSPVINLAKQLMTVCAAANELIYQQPCEFFTPPRGYRPE